MSGKNTFCNSCWYRQGCPGSKSKQSVLMIRLKVQSENGSPVLGFMMALVHLEIAISAHGSSPRFLAAISAEDIQLRARGVHRGAGPRFAPQCLPGNHVSSASTLSYNSHKDCLTGLPPPCFCNLEHTQEKSILPSKISLLASLNANAFACSHAFKRPV